MKQLVVAVAARDACRTLGAPREVEVSTVLTEPLNDAEPRNDWVKASDGHRADDMATLSGQDAVLG
jgi:hypothetical protein